MTSSLPPVAAGPPCTLNVTVEKSIDLQQEGTPNGGRQPRSSAAYDRGSIRVRRFGLVQYVSVAGSKSRSSGRVKPGGIQAVPNI